MAIARKKNQNGGDTNGMEAITADLTEHQAHSRLNSRLLTANVLIALGVGAVGGVLGAMFVAPWYQQNVLGESGSAGQIVENRRIILDEESAIITAVEEVNPAVVSIVVTRDLPTLEQFGSPFGDFFFEFPSPGSGTQPQRVGAGSGFIVDGSGLIVTNRHVVEDTEAAYTVVTKDGQRFDAQVLATDPFNDLAIVKIEGVDLPTVRLGDSGSVRLGQRVIAIGNALGEFQNTVTTGVVSGIGRNITATGGAQTEKLSEVIQTDAAINPGNSGGPLINLAGEVIGVNTAVSQSAQLIGFAIPINQVKKVVSDVREFGKVRRPFLGVRYINLTEALAQLNELPVAYGAWLVRGQTSREPAVVPNSPAAQAGLTEGDVILELDGQRITFERPLADLLRGHNPGDRVTLKVLSDGEERLVFVTLAEAE